jgi:sulfite reductase (ferredoxin)
MRFPVDSLPEEAALARLVGLYPMRQQGLFMQRVKVQGGVLSTDRWRALAAIARSHTPGYPLHVTTRQDVELHGIAADAIGAVQSQIAEAGLTALGAAGDTLRNVTVCPGSGLCTESVDVSGVASAVREAAESLPWIRTLPRKFKISVSGCDDGCARPWINDIGLQATRGGRFHAVVAGSLGPRPRTGIALDRVFSAAEVVPLVVAALTLFNAEGDRKNRGQARLRHVRERLGDAVFVWQLEELFEGETGRGRPVPAVTPVAPGVLEAACLRLPLGDITPEDAVLLAETVDRAQGVIRIGFEHDLRIYTTMAVGFPFGLAAYVGGAAVTACPGTTWCSRGIVDARGAASSIAKAVPQAWGGSVQISGCPNNCAQSAIADIGLIGCVKTVGGARQECFRLVAGGDKGRGPALAEELSPAVPASLVPEVVALAIDEFTNFRKATDVSFGRFVRESRGKLSDFIARRVRLLSPSTDTTREKSD